MLAAKTLLALSVATFSASCSTTIDLEYAFVLKQQNTSKHLGFEDAQFEFNFHALPSGVWFTVHNSSDQSATLDWDHCFFVMPNRNTFNALNTDILNESDKVSSRSAHRTQVPIATSVSRFTTATVATSEYKTVTYKEIQSMLSSTNIEWSGTGRSTGESSTTSSSTGVDPARTRSTSDYSQRSSWKAKAVERTSASFASTLTVDSIEGWQVRKFWPLQLTSAPGRELDALLPVTSLVSLGDTMTLGLRLVHGEDIRDYRFDFTIDAIYATALLRTRSPEGEPRIGRKLLFTAQHNGHWTWVPTEDASAPGKKSKRLQE